MRRFVPHHPLLRHDAAFFNALPLPCAPELLINNDKDEFSPKNKKLFHVRMT